MERRAVRSTNVASVGYDPKSMVLEIEFKRGGVYQYSGVPEKRYQGVGNAELWLMVKWSMAERETRGTILRSVESIPERLLHEAQGEKAQAA